MKFPKHKFNQIAHFFYRILSEDDLHLLEIPEPPTIASKIDNRSSIGSCSAITSEPKASTTKMAANKSHHPYQQSQSSIMFEHDNEQIESMDGKSAINNLKNIIQKLQSVRIYLEFVLNDAFHLKFNHLICVGIE